MQALLDVILPVFLVIGFGYTAVWRGWMSDAGIEGLMKFAQNFAIPALLFRAISTLDLGQDFDLAMLFSFYAGALAGFMAGLFGARFLFGRPWEDSVAIGFIGLFSNSLLLGLAITERAYGADALAANYAIIALHAPFCYGLGITVMEVVRNRGGGGAQPWWRHRANGKIGAAGDVQECAGDRHRAWFCGEPYRLAAARILYRCG